MEDYKFAGNAFGVIVGLGVAGLTIYFIYRAVDGIGGYFGGWLDYFSPSKPQGPQPNPDKK